MKKIGEIKENLAAAMEWEPWMEELLSDSRKSVQSALAGWQRKKNLREKKLLEHQQKIEFDRSFTNNPHALVCGIDEAGRGPLAGPVVTAAVILPKDCSALIGLDDSKKLSKAKRDHYASIIKEIAISYAVHSQPSEEIDAQNIYQATRDSMSQAALQLAPRPDIILADAMRLDTGIRCESIIKGDAKSLAIAAASILAKTGRDAIMEIYAEEYPVYGFGQHAGYGTKEHLKALQEYGPCPIHRKTFEPVKSLLENQHNLKMDF